MLTYFTESEEIKMDVQVGPQEEIEAKVEGEEFCDRCGNPVDTAKKNPDTVSVGCCVNKRTGVKEFYVDAADVAKLAELNEMTMLEALDEIIDVNEGSGMCPDNIVVVMSEGTEMYEHNLERNGAACVHFNESMSEAGEPDIEMDVQVGPNSEEITASEDPQEANPVDAVKRQYDSVVVAKDGDKFFMDVEDVQKCAELNCESVIDTLNGIIDVHEGFDMNTENVVIVVTENAREDVVNTLIECGANFVIEAKYDDKNSDRKRMIKDLSKVVKDFLIDNDIVGIGSHKFYVGGDNAKFVKGDGKTVLIGLKITASSYDPSRDLRIAIKGINDNKDKLISAIENQCEGCKVSSVKIQNGRMGAINVAITFSEFGY